MFENYLLYDNQQPSSFKLEKVQRLALLWYNNFNNSRANTRLIDRVLEDSLIRNRKHR